MAVKKTVPFTGTKEQEERLLATIAEYLIKVETLTKADIDEIEKTGKLGWYEEKIAAKVEATQNPSEE